MSRRFWIIAAAAASAAVLAFILLRSGWDERNLTEPEGELVEAARQMFGALKLGEPFVHDMEGPDHDLGAASIEAVSEFCLSKRHALSPLDFYDNDDAGLLFAALQQSCDEVDSPALLNPGGESDYPRVYRDAILRIESALRPYGGPPGRPYQQLATWHDPRATPTPQELRSIVEDTAWVVYGSLAAYEHGCGRAGQPSDCDKIADFVSGIHITMARCGEADYQDSFRGHSNYDPQLMEPLLTSLQLACRTLRQAQETLGPPADNQDWLNVVTKARATLEPALPDINKR
jgi:hypothetical protein